MIYPRYGQTFRMLREQKQLPLSAFTYAGVSKPALSKFERGESMMSFEKVFLALQIMNVSLGEFEYLLHDYELDEPNSLIFRIEEEMLNHHQEKLSLFYDEALEAGLDFVALATKSIYSSLTSTEVDLLTDFLYDIEIWGLIELYIFYFSIHQLYIKDLSFLLKTFFTGEHKPFQSEKHGTVFVKLCCKSVLHLSCMGYKNEAFKLLQQLEMADLTQNVLNQIHMNMAHAHWVLLFKNKKQGIGKIQKNLNILSEYGPPQIYNHYKLYFANFISQ